MMTNNAYLRGDLASHGITRDAADAQMDQIRDLLFGNVRAEILGRLEALERRVGDLEGSLAALRREDVATRQADLDGLAAGVASLATQIRSLSRT